MLKKHLTGLVLAAALLLSLAPDAAARPSAFWDVRRGDWFAPCVYALADAGIVNGMEPERYDPSGEVTRAQLVKLMAAWAADERALEASREDDVFSDVLGGDWFAPYVNWSAAHEIAAGYPDGRFLPNGSVTRAEAALFITRFAAHCDGVDLKNGGAGISFTDGAVIPDWAADAVAQCVRGGIFQGYDDGSFRPEAHMTRAESAAVLCRLLDVAPIPEEAVPDAQRPEHIEREIAGCAAEAIVFPPHGYTGRIVLAHDRLFQVENALDILTRSGAYIGATGAFFDMRDLTTYSNLVIDGSPVRIENNSTAAAPSLVIAESGAVSIEFMRPEQTLTRTRDGETAAAADDTARNRVPYDPDGPAREIVVYTAVYGDAVPAGFTRIAVCDAGGTVTAFFDEPSEQIPIPETGSVVAEHGSADFLTDCAVGDVITSVVAYAGSRTQDIRAALSCGPTVVKDGMPYGNAETYAEEGFFADDIVEASARRIAVGVRADGSVVFATAACTMETLGVIMAELGCETAMNLDGGASTCLRAGEIVIREAGRQLNTMILFTID